LQMALVHSEKDNMLFWQNWRCVCNSPKVGSSGIFKLLYSIYLQNLKKQMINF